MSPLPWYRGGTGGFEGGDGVKAALENGYFGTGGGAGVGGGVGVGGMATAAAAAAAGNVSCKAGPYSPM